MCRFLVYKGKYVLIGDVVEKPENSLIFQSRDAGFHPGCVDPSGERNIRVNGDGFGVSWYGSDTSKGSCVFKFITPAWSNDNLKNLGEHVSSHLIFAHVRAASSGRLTQPDLYTEPVIISNENCHPFKYGRWTFMHNGGIPHFSKVKRRLLASLSERAFNNIIGSTDSEALFSMLLDTFPDPDVQMTANAIALCVEHMLGKLICICHAEGIDEGFSFNICVSDGINIIATRYRNDDEDPPSLYYTRGSVYDRQKGNFSCHRTEQDSEIIIASAPLHNDVSVSSSLQYESKCHKVPTPRVLNGWKLIPKNHCIVVEGDPANLSFVKLVTMRAIVPHSCTSSCQLTSCIVS